MKNTNNKFIMIYHSHQQTVLISRNPCVLIINWTKKKNGFHAFPQHWLAEFFTFLTLHY